MNQMFFGNARVMLFTPNGSSAPANNGYDVTFNLGDLPPSGNFSDEDAGYTPSNWYNDNNVEIWFSNGSQRQMQESDMGTTLHNVIGFSFIPSGSEWNWVDENSESIDNHGHYWEDDESEPADPYFKLEENITVYAISC